MTHDVPAHALMAGVPARRIGWACECGQVLDATDGAGVCGACGRRYREHDPDHARGGAGIVSYEVPIPILDLRPEIEAH